MSDLTKQQLEGTCGCVAADRPQAGCRVVTIDRPSSRYILQSIGSYEMLCISQDSSSLLKTISCSRSHRLDYDPWMQAFSEGWPIALPTTAVSVPTTALSVLTAAFSLAAAMPLSTTLAFEQWRTGVTGGVAVCGTVIAGASRSSSHSCSYGSSILSRVLPSQPLPPASTWSYSRHPRCLL